MIRIARRVRVAAWASGACLAGLLAACGGGGGETPATPTPVGPPVEQPTEPPPARTLAAHLGACPSMDLINQAAPCLVGTYEGVSPDTGGACALVYRSDGVVQYLAGNQGLRAILSWSGSGSVIVKQPAATPSGFTIEWSAGIASGQDLDLYYQSDKEPASASGLHVRALKVAMPSCLITQAPAAAATESATTANLLGRQWAAPNRLSDSGRDVDQRGTEVPFEAGLADDGRAVVVFRQTEADGSAGVYVVEGRAGAAGVAPSWTAPLRLDAAAPLAKRVVARPRAAMSATGHAVVSWMAELPCEADAYETEPAGKTCRYLYATRKLATASAWEAPQRVRATPPANANDHTLRINAAGDATLAFLGFAIEPWGPNEWASLAVRAVGDATWRIVELRSFQHNPFSDTPVEQRLLVDVDDAGRVQIAGMSAATFIDVARASTTISGAPASLAADAVRESGIHTYELQASAGWAAYTWRTYGGPYTPEDPERISFYSPVLGRWGSGEALDRFALWGRATLIGTDAADGEFLLFAGCRVTAWRSGSWGATTSLPAYCGRDDVRALTAYNRQGDYLAVDWGGQGGQWGYYSRVQDRLLKGAPGSTGAAVAADYVLGTRSGLFDEGPTQLMLARGGLGLVVTSVPYDALPSAAAPTGAGATAPRLWAVYLK